MRRPVLLTLVVLGILVSLIGSTGLFAALTDTARSGTNSVDSAEVAGSADIQLATGTPEGASVVCGAFTEDLATGLFTASDVEAGWYPNGTFVCVRNVGSQPVTISALVDELVDTDSGCTGDEELHGDTTCGGDLLGELSTVLRLQHERTDCNTGERSDISGMTLKANETSAHSFSGTLAPGETGCYAIFMFYPTYTAATDVQKAQSDTVTWRFKFIAEA